jgi:hypothetical protein
MWWTGNSLFFGPFSGQYVSITATSGKMPKKEAYALPL